jgi:beta-glucanase (GH16 family)
MLRHNRTILLAVSVAIAIAGGVIFKHSTKAPDKSSEPKEWVLIWSDEFEGPDGSSVDQSKWTQEEGGRGWGNNEHQYYTKGTDNCYIQDNHLVIEAKQDDSFGNPYTSARIKTSGKFDFQYGRVEMRAKIPYGQGIWPAFWMLGSDIERVSWPDCGEIDIMENIGKEPRRIHGTIHGPGYSGSGGIGRSFTLNENFSNDFHIYSIEWSENKIEWFFNGEKFNTITSDNIAQGKWVFNKEFFLLLNLAVGGNWPGYPDETTVFPQKYIIDYVRVYQLK